MTEASGAAPPRAAPAAAGQHPAGKRSPRARLWPAVLALGLVAQAAGVLTMVAIAARDPSFAIEPRYYERAIAWDAESRRDAEGRALGWAVRVEASPRGGDTGRVELRAHLADAEGRPLEGARVRAEAFHQARAAERASLSLEARGDGVYAAALSGARTGLYEVRLTIQRGPEELHTLASVAVSEGVRAGARPSGTQPGGDRP
jgi:nitrogen fixation protein FixH